MNNSILLSNPYKPGIETILGERPPEVAPCSVGPEHHGCHHVPVLLNQQLQSVGIIQVSHRVNDEYIVAGFGLAEFQGLVSGVYFLLFNWDYLNIFVYL